jgi:hypothetical protein
MYEDAKKDRNVFASDKGRAGKFPRLILKLTQYDCDQITFRLIPSDPTAIEVGLSHASRTNRTMSVSGILLSNT